MGSYMTSDIRSKEDHDLKSIETLCILAGMAIVFGLLFKTQILYYVALALLGIAVFLKNVASKISYFWLAFANFLGTVNSKIILSMIFFLLLTPIAAFYRVLHGDFMEIKMNRKRETGYKTRNHLYIPKDLQDVW